LEALVVERTKEIREQHTAGETPACRETLIPPSTKKKSKGKKVHRKGKQGRVTKGDVIRFVWGEGGKKTIPPPKQRVYLYLLLTARKSGVVKTGKK